MGGAPTGGATVGVEGISLPGPGERGGGAEERTAPRTTVRSSASSRSSAPVRPRSLGPVSASDESISNTR